MSKHTPGPWHSGLGGVYAPAGYEKNVQVAEVWGDENRARIVACVNFCEGYDNETLEKGLDELVGNYVKAAVSGSDTLRAQRDELLRVAKLANEVLERHGCTLGDLNAAIAKAGGGL